VADLQLAHVDGPPLERLEELIWMGSLARLGAERHPRRDAIVFVERNVRVSYSELDRQSDAFVALMNARGIRPGERIAYLGRNSDLYFPTLFGAIRAGIVLVPINWRLAAPEIAYQLQDSESRLVICDPALSAIARAAMENLRSAPQFLSTEDDETAENLRALLSHPARHLAGLHQRNDGQSQGSDDLALCAVDSAPLRVDIGGFRLDNPGLCLPVGDAQFSHGRNVVGADGLGEIRHRRDHG
jgi:acyl-CoA synthetase (AMP-forming)/AMP-acid ligase II